VREVHRLEVHRQCRPGPVHGQVHLREAHGGPIDECLADETCRLEPGRADGVVGGHGERPAVAHRAVAGDAPDRPGPGCLIGMRDHTHVGPVVADRERHRRRGQRIGGQEEHGLSARRARRQAEHRGRPLRAPGVGDGERPARGVDESRSQALADEHVELGHRLESHPASDLGQRLGGPGRRYGQESGEDWTEKRVWFHPCTVGERAGLRNGEAAGGAVYGVDDLSPKGHRQLLDALASAAGNPRAVARLPQMNGCFAAHGRFHLSKTRSQSPDADNFGVEFALPVERLVAAWDGGVLLREVHRGVRVQQRSASLGEKPEQRVLFEGNGGGTPGINQL
jgi:hypothetical protein